MKKIEFLFYLVIVLFVIFIFRSWFTSFSLSTGDWGYKFPKAIQGFSICPFAWDVEFHNRLGGSTIFLLALNTYFHAATVFLAEVLHIPWILIEKIMWFWPYIIVSMLGSFLLFRRLISRDATFALISSLIFTTNTYALMITGGGQMGVAMGYAMIPFVVWGFTGTLEDLNYRKILKRSVLAGLLFAIQLLFDLRLAYATLILLGIYYLVFLLRVDFWALFKKTFLFFAIIPGIVIVGLNFFWLVPFFVVGQNPLNSLGETFTGVGIVKFLSFAKFENTISLLQPNWPENIFGKVYFMRPDFIVLPIFAFLSLLFIKKDKNDRVIFAMVIIGLIGAFLAKGSGEPFGEIYIWLFQKFPGFQMFRDSTKWYGFVALSFSLLVPYTLMRVSSIRFKQHTTYYILLTTFLLFWAFTIRQNFLGELKGTFAPHKSPSEYFQLADFLSTQSQFFRTLWFPSLHQYSYSSASHPAIPGGDFLSVYSNKAILQKMGQKNIVSLLDDSSIKYVIVPSDTEGKLFTTDRKYSKKKYDALVSGLKKVSVLKQIKQFGRIVVFENKEYKNHLWMFGTGLVSFKAVSPVLYKAEVSGVTNGGKLIFAENYDPHWIARVNGKKVISQRYKLFNSFALTVGSSTVDIYYEPQDLVDRSIPVSAAAFIIVVIILAWSDKKKSGRKLFSRKLKK